MDRTKGSYAAQKSGMNKDNRKFLSSGSSNGGSYQGRDISKRDNNRRGGPRTGDKRDGNKSSHTIEIDSVNFPPLGAISDDTPVPTPGYTGEVRKYTFDDVINIVKNIQDAKLPKDIRPVSFTNVVLLQLRFDNVLFVLFRRNIHSQ